MPKTKVQKIVFGLLMSYTMAIGMEIYNIAYKQGVHLEAGGFSSMMNGVFPAALAEAGYMGLLVFCFLIYGEIVLVLPLPKNIQTVKRTIRISARLCVRPGR